LTTNTYNYFIQNAVYEVPENTFQRLRLASAMIRVSYQGNVLNQSGKMISCAVFDPFSLWIGNTAGVTAYPELLADRYTVFTNVVNGLWNQTVNITNNAQGVECLYVPTDPDDMLYQRINTFYGSEIYKTVGGRLAPDREGAHINYVVAGSNLPPNAPILVEIFSIYEAIPDPISAPYLTPSVEAAWGTGETTDLKEAYDTIAKAGTAIRPAKEWKWEDVLKDVAKLGLTYLPKVLSLFA
jgi:hypothetical protein